MKNSIFGYNIRINNGRPTNMLWLLHLHTLFMFNFLHNTIVGATGSILISGVAFKKGKMDRFQNANVNTPVCFLH